jgi:hypothetical protein
VELSFAPREEAWRRRGRQPIAVPDEVLVLLRRVSNGQDVGVLRMGPEDTAAELEQWKTWLRAGARQLGGRVRFQDDPGVLRYEVWGMTA